jgi:7-cyano-7-deazaguanine synthase
VPNPPNVLLCSGGVDSSTLASHVAGDTPLLNLCFVDYGQPARHAERRSAKRMADSLGLPIHDLGVSGVSVPTEGEIPFRNALLITATLAAFPGAQVILVGFHAGTGYRDCSSGFVELMQGLADFHTQGRVRISAPFLTSSKGDVIAVAQSLSLDLSLCHSCERADDPCGECRSCLDRAEFV